MTRYAQLVADRDAAMASDRLFWLWTLGGLAHGTRRTMVMTMPTRYPQPAPSEPRGCRILNA